MQPKIRRVAAVLVGAAATLATASSFACTIAPRNPYRIRQLMAQEIAHRLGITAARIPLSAITLPQLHAPFPLGADCSGLGAYHYSAGFRWQDMRRPGPQPMPLPQPPSRTEGLADIARLPPGSAAARPVARQCSYEGVAVLLGFDYSSPVTVHFQRRCH